MKTVKKILWGILYFVSGSLILCAIFSLFRNSSVRYFKMLDFPRIQFFIASIICLILLLLLVNSWKRYKIILVSGLVLGVGIHTFFLINYTGLVDVEVPSAEIVKNSDNHFSLLLANVKMTNRNSADLIKLIREKNPDLILGMEIDLWWNQQLKYLEKEYPYFQRVINDETYGMILYSKYPLENLKVNYLNNKKVPSFECLVTLKNGQKIDLHCLHPVPPMRFEDLPDNVGQRDIAMKKLGKEIQNNKYPIVVAGDMNDVVWAEVDELTGTKNILHDTRVGRGFLNTFNAENPFMRWPLDHVFVSKQFRLNTLERMPKIGSDHFPLFVRLSL
ncbi:endonuclease/exonuclease/phosphatase family protein [Kaistella polysaccharea]|uniref:endonuclease/exonuclease/phosphatase family protein n=1 Tax=Kaistella polysaccharea TaxID=2878534 RepID=UPI001CF325B3|nr:endonuclease/exonuclease/phosphatase family protein [Kaistella polysaccharea]